MDSSQDPVDEQGQSQARSTKWEEKNLRIGIPPVPPVSSVDVRDDVAGRRPEVLQEAENSSGGGGVLRVGRSKSGEESRSLNECSILRGESEIRGAADFFPQVETTDRRVTLTGCSTKEREK